MSTIVQPGGAKIYTFPRRVRGLAGGSRREDHTVADLQPRAYAVAECGSGWYHEAAVQDAERAMKP